MTILATIIGNIQTWDGIEFSELDNSPLTFSEGTVAPMVSQTVPVTTASMPATTAVLVMPQETVSQQNNPGITGVLTDLGYAPSGSLGSSAVTIEERVGTFAYLPAFATALSKVNKDFAKAEKKAPFPPTFPTDNDVVTEAEELLTAADSNTDIQNSLLEYALFFAMVPGLKTLADDIYTLQTIAGEWETPEFFEAKGSSTKFKQLQSDPANGIDLVKVSGNPATWKVNNKQTGGDIMVTGFTAETTTVTFIKFGVPIVSPVYNVLDADQSGSVVTAATAKTALPAPTSVRHANTKLLAQSMAAFSPSSGVAASGSGNLAEHHRSLDFLAANSPHHG